MQTEWFYVINCIQNEVEDELYPAAGGFFPQILLTQEKLMEKRIHLESLNNQLIHWWSCKIFREDYEQHWIQWAATLNIVNLIRQISIVMIGKSFKRNSYLSLFVTECQSVCFPLFVKSNNRENVENNFRKSKKNEQRVLRNL